MTYTHKKSTRLFSILLSLAVMMTMLVTPVSAATVKAKKMTVSPKSATLVVGEKTKITVKSVTPKKASKAVTYKSSNKKVATVSKKGVVTAKKKGTAKITVTSKSNKKLKKTIKITVRKSVPMNKSIFVSAQQVKTNCYTSSGSVKSGYVLADVGWGKDYAFAKHLPGAIHINTDSVEYDDCDPWPQGDQIDDIGQYDPSNGMFGKIEVKDPDTNMNLRSASDMVKMMNHYGINSSKTVVLYGATADKPAFAGLGRVAFALMNAGVKVKIMSGGQPEWVAAGFKTASNVVNPKSVTDAEYNDQGYVASIDEVQANLGNDKYKLVSIRTIEETYGEVSGYDYVDNGGAPKGSVWGHNTDDGSYAVNGKIAGYSVLQKYMTEANVAIDDPDTTVAFYCGTGWRATIPWLIAYNNGNKNVKLYDGGWMQWKFRHEQDAAKYPIDDKCITPAVAETNAAATDSKFVLLDVRKVEDYNADHAVGAISAAVNPTNTTPSSEEIDNIHAAVQANGKDKSYVVICYTGNAYANRAIELLRAEGVDDLNIYRLVSKNFKHVGGTDPENGGFAAWKNEGLATEPTYYYVSQDDLATHLSDYTILDVREEADYLDGHIDGAVGAAVPGADATGDEALANLSAAIQGKASTQKYAIICYSGNKYAKAATRILVQKLGVNYENIFTLTGGFKEWAKTRTFVTGGVTVDPVAKTATFDAVVNPDFLTPDADGDLAPISHLILSGNGGAGTDAPFLAETVAPLGLHAALKVLGGIPWSDTARTFEDGKKLSEVTGDNDNYSHLNVTVNGKDVASYIKYKKNGVGTATDIDMVYSGNYENQKAWGTGCIACAFSCYAGVTSNNNIGISTCTKDNNYMYLDSSMLTAGQTVHVVYTIK